MRNVSEELKEIKGAIANIAGEMGGATDTKGISDSVDAAVKKIAVAAVKVDIYNNLTLPVHVADSALVDDTVLVADSVLVISPYYNDDKDR